jgi:hypothetical protein
MRKWQGRVMSDVISVAADALLPILAAGGGAVATGAAGEAGSELYQAATSVLAKIGKRMRGGRVSKAEVVSALQSTLQDGELTMPEVERLCAAYRGSGSAVNNFVGEVKAKASFVGNVTIDTLNIGGHDK